MKYLLFLTSLCILLFCSSCAEKKAEEAAKEPATIEVAPKKQVNPMVKKASAQDVIVGGMEWLSLEELQIVAKTDKKKVLVDVYTDWCGWCKVMDKKTFTDPEVKKYLADNFHVVKFNAEQKAPIVFKGKEYNWKPSGRRGVNMLAVEMLNGRLGYPTIVYLDEDLNKIKAVAGYKTPSQLMADIKSL
jgi:thioredoxin-related protein